MNRPKLCWKLTRCLFAERKFRKECSASGPSGVADAHVDGDSFEPERRQKNSEPAGIRTQDLRIKSPLLYQLSYELRLHCLASCDEQGAIMSPVGRKTVRKNRLNVKAAQTKIQPRQGIIGKSCGNPRSANGPNRSRFSRFSPFASSLDI